MANPGVCKSELVRDGVFRNVSETQPIPVVVGPNGPQTQKRVWDEGTHKFKKIELGI
ncbi:hypothetical protein F5X99DRAFT_407981 [Biscogniauxia marginata]|nr:hypothetical protein F5X99DRAFT_407981 [Biscogniauxia marginata]